MDLTFVNLTEKPELTAAMWAVHSTWPEFMVHEPLADRYYPRLAATFPEHQILGVAADGKVVARINSVPFKWTGSDEGLPDQGWDAAIETAFSDGVRATCRQFPCRKPGSHRTTRAPDSAPASCRRLSATIDDSA